MSESPVVVHVHIHLDGVLAPVLAQLDRMEAKMATEAEILNQLSAKFDSFVSDVNAALAALQAERDQLGPDGQAAVDRLTAAVDAAQAAVGDADGDGVPAPAEPVL